MLKYTVSPNAQVQINEILVSVTEYTGYPTSAIKLFDALYKKFDLIALFPDAIGRLREDGTREAFERRYRIVYRVKPDVIEIIAVLHSSRIYPRPEQNP